MFWMKKSGHTILIQNQINYKSNHRKGKARGICPVNGFIYTIIVSLFSFINSDL